MSDQVTELEPQVPGSRFAGRLHDAAFLAAIGTTTFGWLIFLGGVYRLSM